MTDQELQLLPKDKTTYIILNNKYVKWFNDYCMSGPYMNKVILKYIEIVSKASNLWIIDPSTRFIHRVEALEKPSIKITQKIVRLCAEDIEKIATEEEIILYFLQ